MKKYNFIDLFAGCGGFSEGFEKNGNYSFIAAVEWEKAPSTCLINRLKTKWCIIDAEKKVLQFDIQREEELFKGWVDPDYGEHVGLNKIIGKQKVDLIIGGPPCQAYSIAGRVRDKNGMHFDYRNYLFESYLNVVKRCKPKVIIFENVSGILSAKPGGISIIDRIKTQFNQLGYSFPSDLKKDGVINVADYGIPQNRKRIIIIGLRKDIFKNNSDFYSDCFYKELLPRYKVKKKTTVKDAIGDLGVFYPSSIEKKQYKKGNRGLDLLNHEPRFHNTRDIEIFSILADDIKKGHNKYTSINELKKLYTKMTNKESSIHKYYVLRENEQSNLIPAHLHKDGLRHIHPDPKQARSITVREAARLQSFDDDFYFTGTQSDNYKMIGNAVPPKFAEAIANAVYMILKEKENE